MTSGPIESWNIFKGEQGDAPRIGSDDKDDRWLDLLLTHRSTQLVSNVDTEWGLIEGNGLSMPLTVNDTEYGNSYVCSPYNGCIQYPLSEVALLPSRTLRIAMRTLIWSMAGPLRAGQINRVVCVNNWLLSTNLYTDWTGVGVKDLTQTLIHQFPTHAIAFRSLNVISNRLLLRELEQSGYLLLPSRQVYFFDGAEPSWLRRPNTHWDQKLLESTSYRVLSHEELSGVDWERVEELYRMLYIDKYSPHNPQFTSQMLKELHRRGIWKMWGLLSPEGSLDGVVGVFDRGGTMTAPLVGYDTAIPQKIGLYRMLMAIVMRETVEKRWRLNLSSGAAEFKRLRGGSPSIEFTAVYVSHLSRRRRGIWRLLAWLLMNVGAPLLKKYEL